VKGYLKKKEAIEYAQVSKSTLERELDYTLEGVQLTRESSPDYIQEHTQSIVKVIDKEVFEGGSKRNLYHWEFSFSFLEKLKEKSRKKAQSPIPDHTQEGVQRGFKEGVQEHSQEGIQKEKEGGSEYSQEYSQLYEKRIEELKESLNREIKSKEGQTEYLKSKLEKRDENFKQLMNMLEQLQISSQKLQERVFLLEEPKEAEEPKEPEEAEEIKEEEIEEEAPKETPKKSFWPFGKKKN